VNETFKAVIVQLTGGNVRNYHINLRGTFGIFPEDALGGSSKDAQGCKLEVRFGSERTQTDIDEGKAIFRERGAVRRFFEERAVKEGDYVLIERLSERTYRVDTIAKRIFEHYL
jgi:hypothetical protein